jgi:tetratricopeptide (TPR) repeat protein
LARVNESPENIRLSVAHTLHSECQSEQCILALNYYYRAFEIFARVDDFSNQAITLNSIALIYNDLGQYQEASRTYLTALSTLNQGADISFSGILFNNLGEVNRKIGTYSNALGYLTTAIGILPDDSLDKASALNNLGLIYQEVGQFGLASSFFQKALEIQQDAEDSNRLGTTLHNIGFLYDEQDNLAKAEEYYRRSLDERAESDIQDLRGKAMTLNNLGLLYSRLGKHLEATQTIEEALGIVERLGDIPRLGIIIDSMGTVYKNKGDYPAALAYYTQALEILQSIENRSGAGIVLTNIGLLYEAMNNPQAAITTYEKAISESIEPIWSDLRGEELQVSYADKHVDTYAKLIHFLWNEGRYEEAFNYTERARSRVFLNQIVNGPNEFISNVNNSELSNSIALKKEIEDLESQIQVLSQFPLDGINASSIAQLQQELDTKQTEYIELVNQLKDDDLETADLVSVNPADLEEVQALIGQDSSLVSYFVTDDKTLAFVVTPSSLEVVELEPDRQQLEATVQLLYAYDFAALDNSHSQNLRQLHEWLIAPLAPYIEGSAHLEIVPHNILHYVPFAALSDGQTYLIDRYTISNLPSASVKRFLEAKRKPETNTLVALGNPTFDLIHAGREVKAISSMFEVPELELCSFLVYGEKLGKGVSC